MTKQSSKVEEILRNISILKAKLEGHRSEALEIDDIKMIKDNIEDLTIVEETEYFIQEMTKSEKQKVKRVIQKLESERSHCEEIAKLAYNKLDTIGEAHWLSRKAGLKLAIDIIKEEFNYEEEGE